MARQDFFSGAGLYREMANEINEHSTSDVIYVLCPDININQLRSLGETNKQSLPRDSNWISQIQHPDDQHLPPWTRNDGLDTLCSQAFRTAAHLISPSHLRLLGMVPTRSDHMIRCRSNHFS